MASSRRLPQRNTMPIMAGMNITPKRMETLAFTQPYAGGPHGFMTLKSSPLAKLPTGDYNLTKDLAAAEKAIDGFKDQFKGKIIGVQGSTTNSAFAEKYFKGVRGGPRIQDNRAA